MGRRLFGTDGVRGTANVWPMTAEVAMQLGRALAYLIRNGTHRHRVVIGKDTRLSGYMLEQALAAGICSMGVDVMLVGPLPTPGIAYITPSMRADAGRRHQRLAQPLPGQRHQVLLAATASSCPTRRRHELEELMRQPARRTRFGPRRTRWGAPSASTTPAAATWSF